MIATFYARVSTDRDEQQQSIENQVEYFKDYLIKHNYSEAVGCGQLSRKDGTDEILNGYYVDEGLTASKSDIKNRRSFNQLIKDAKAKKFSIIFVKSISRFSRSTETTIKLIKDLKELGIGVYFDDLKLNSLEGHNEMLITMFASVAQEESRQKSESIHFGVMRGIKNGKWTSSAPFGYDKIDGFLQINIDEAKVVKQIFDWYLIDNIGIKIITNRLRELKVPTKRTKINKRTGKLSEWSHATVKNILNNPIYTGRMIQNRTRKIDINRGIVKFNPKEEYIIHNLEELRIIDDIVYKKTQKEKDLRMKKLGTYEYLTRTRDYEGEIYTQKVRVQATGRNGRHSSAHLFSNLFYCGHCNAPMRRRKNYHYKTRNKDFDMSTLDYHYVCYTYDVQGKSACAHRNMIYEKDLEQQVIERLLKKKEENFDSLKERMIGIKFDVRNNDKKIAVLEHEINELESEKTGLVRMQLKNLINEQDYLKQYERIVAEIQERTKKLNSENQIFLEIDKFKDDFESAVDELRDLNVANLTNGKLRKMINKINIVEEDGNKFIDIDWKFLDENFDATDYSDIQKIPLL